MMREGLKRNLKNLVKGRVFLDEPLKNHTSLQIGGPVDALVIPFDENDLRHLLNFANRNDIQITVVGNGTKLLVSDEGVDGIAIKICGCFDNVAIHGTRVSVGGGYLLSSLSRLTADHALSGLEFAICIPGTVGGGIVMNAGAHGSMISNVLVSVEAISCEGKVKRYTKEEIKYGYRQSAFQSNHSIVLSAVMNLRRDASEVIRNRMNEYIEWRKNQPLDLPNAGSIFKNPLGASAGQLIDMAGLKGLQIGGAKISDKRANFIVNLGNATGNDVLTLMNIAAEAVLQKFGTTLEPEIRIVGRFSTALS